MKSYRTVVAWLALVAVLGLAGTASAQRRGGPPGPGGPPAFDTLLAAFDANDDGALSKEEVPGRVWSRLSGADADGDGVVTAAEFDAARKGG